MNPAIVAAMVISGGTIIASVITAVVTVRRNKAKLTKSLEQQQQEASKSLHDIMLVKYGFKAASVFSKSEIVDLDGSSKTTRKWNGVKVREGVTWSHIHQRIWVGTPGGKSKHAPTLTSHSNFPKDLSLAVLKRTDQECEYQLEITGALSANDPPLDFEVEVEFSKSVLMCREDVEEAYRNDLFKRDYHSMDIEFPIDSLELSVVFPENFPVQLFAGVFNGRSEVLHEQEYTRVKGGFKADSRGATFSIDSPLIGFRYFIYWCPPPRRVPQQ